MGWCGKGPSSIQEADSVRQWVVSQWLVKEPFTMAKLGKGLWLFEFENKEETKRVLKFGRRRYGGNL